MLEKKKLQLIKNKIVLVCKRQKKYEIAKTY